MNYEVLAEDLHAFVVENKLDKPDIIGHSMGGKAAMNFAVKYPTLLRKLVVVDIVPKAYPIHHDHILEGLHALQLDKLTSRGEADTLLAAYVPEPDVRQFLLKNLSRNDAGKFAWRINLPAIDSNIEALGSGMIFSGKHDGPSLFIRGEKSNYYEPGDEARIKAIFPNAQFQQLDTGHWVQAEKPAEFAQVVLTWLAL